MSNNPNDRYFEKTVWEEFPFEHDFAPAMPPGSGTLASISEVIAAQMDGSPAPTVLNGYQVTPSSTKCTVNVKAGSANVQYEIRIRGVTNSGAKVEAIVIMKVLP